MSYYTDGDLRDLGIADFGERVRISPKVSIHGSGRLEIGSDVRIDDYCVISAGEEGISIGSFIHVAVFCSLIGQGRIELHDFSGLSSRVSIYSSNDDYSGQWMTNPTIPAEFSNVTHDKVVLSKHVIVGSGSVILPGVTLEEGVAIGALSLVKRDCLAFGIYQGNPAKRIAERKRDLLRREEDFKKKSRTY